MDIRPRTSEIAARLSTAPPWQTFLIVFLPLLAIYLVTMGRANFQSNPDAVASALPAWRFAQYGDTDLSAFQGQGLQWIIETGNGVVSNRPPGIAFVSTPLYWLFGSRSFHGVVPSMLPASATAAAFSAGAVAILHLILRRLTTNWLAIMAAFVFGLGTSTWSMAANELWPHGPAMFFLALGSLLLVRAQLFPSGLSFGLALLIRPVTALIGAVTGLTAGLGRRSWRPVVMIGLGSAVGLGLFLWYNAAVIGELSLAPDSYGASFVERARDQSILGYLGDVGGMLFHPKYSVFVFSPFLLFTLAGLKTAWKESPTWVRTTAVAGVVYILVHLRLNRFSGGPPFNYRYPLEMLIMVAPLLFLSWKAWYDQAGALGRRLFSYSVVLSFGVQAVAIVIEFTNPTVL